MYITRVSKGTTDDRRGVLREICRRNSSHKYVRLYVNVCVYKTVLCTVQRRRRRHRRVPANRRNAMVLPTGRSVFFSGTFDTVFGPDETAGGAGRT